MKQLLSEIWPRSFVFQLFAHSLLEKIHDECYFQDMKYRNDLESEKTKKCRLFKAAEWNAVYRSALRKTTRKDEVDRRRSQGRNIRNLFFPALLAPFLISSNKYSFSCAISLGIVMIFMYAYAEYINFAEAYDISELKVSIRQKRTRYR